MRPISLSCLEISLPRIELVGARIRLRPNCEEFSPQLHAATLESVETVGRWMSWCHGGRTQDEGTDWLRKSRVAWDAGDEYEFSLFDDAGKYIGAAGLNQFNRVHNFANLGYWVRQSRQGNGFAAEAIRLLAAFAFLTLRLTRIEIVVAAENRRSRHVAEKAGAEYEGLARNRVVIGELAVTAAVYSLVPTTNDAACNPDASAAHE